MKKRLTLRRGAALAALLAGGSAALLGAVPVSASVTSPLPLLPTTTTVTATPNSQPQNADDTVTVTATVGPLDLYLTPRGTVYFTVWAPGATLGINTSNIDLSTCVILLSTCQASLTFPVGASNSVNDGDVVPGVYTVEAHYSGDSLSKGSNGYGSFTITSPS
jgi:hypothetical protein